MIPRVARLGTGFVGAGQYYLHDKRNDAQENDRPAADAYFLHDKGGAQTSNRVGFTATRNLPTEDPAKALKVMAWVASNAQSIRQAAVAAEAHAAGMSYDAYVREKNPYRGRKVEKPVYSMSIAWHPTRNRKPTDAQMLAAMDEVIGVLGLKEHQAVIIQHTDTKHPHVHLIVNRIHLTTGKAVRLGNDYLKVSKWALEFEKRTGLIVCPVRVDNWQRRDAARIRKAEARKTDPKAKGEWVLAKDVPRGDHDWFKSVAHLPPGQIRQARAARQEREREKVRLTGVRREAHVEGIITRKYGLAKGAAQNELERLLRAEGWRKHRDRHPVALILSPRHLAHALIDVFTARAYFRKRRIKALDSAISRLERASRVRRGEEQSIQIAAGRRMKQRHAAERKRDEERIAAMARGSRSQGAAERGRKVFNWRAGVETAQHVPQGKPILSISRIHAAVSNTAEGLRERGRNALSAITRALGHGVPTETLRKITVGGWPKGRPTPTDGRATTDEGRRVASQDGDALPGVARLEPAAGIGGPLPVEPVNRTTPVETERKNNKGKTLDHIPDRPVVTAADRAAFEARRDARLAELQASEGQRQRRKRVRPRGKVRRLE